MYTLRALEARKLLGQKEDDSMFGRNLWAKLTRFHDKLLLQDHGLVGIGQIDIEPSIQVRQRQAHFHHRQASPISISIISFNIT